MAYLFWKTNKERKISKFKNAVVEISCNASIRKDSSLGFGDAPGNGAALQRAKKKIRQIIKSNNLERAEYLKLYKKYISLGKIGDSKSLKSNSEVKSEIIDRMDDKCPELEYQFIDI